VLSSRPLVSIVIPVFNGADFLAQAVESALAQTWSATEILVVDDGSNDDGATRAVMERFGSRVRRFHKPNGGVGSALNLGLQHMQGEYFSWLSHDDLFEPHKTERQVEALLQFGRPAISFSDWRRIDEQGRDLKLFGVRGEDFVRYPLWSVLEGRINGCTLLVPRACFDTCGRFHENLPTTQDYELWFRFALQFPFLHVPEPLVRQRTHRGQGSRDKRHLEEASLLWMEMLDRIPPDIMRAYCGDERAFIERTLRFLRGTSYKGAIAGVEQRLRDIEARRGRASDVMIGRSGT
jgi:glycosyltransferase involved in cell wall biosynthesis